jgi:hypothetical protein
MGFLATDLSPLGQPSPLVPTSKDVVVKAFQVARTDTTAALKALLPADASIINIDIFGTASDAGTTATLSIGTSATSTELVVTTAPTAVGVAGVSPGTDATRVGKWINVGTSDVRIFVLSSTNATGGVATLSVSYVQAINAP